MNIQQVFEAKSSCIQDIFMQYEKGKTLLLDPSISEEDKMKIYVHFNNKADEAMMKLKNLSGKSFFPDELSEIFSVPNKLVKK